MIIVWHVSLQAAPLDMWERGLKVHKRRSNLKYRYLHLTRLSYNETGQKISPGLLSKQAQNHQKTFLDIGFEIQDHYIKNVGI